MKSSIKLKVFPDIDKLSSAAADIFISFLKTDGDNTFIIPGGSTPELFYKYLSKKISDWKNITLIPSDERLVSECSLHSNIGMIKKNLFTRINKPIYPRLVSIINDFIPEESQQILKSLNSTTRKLLPPKAAFLGIGSDGHTASLFPGIKKNSYTNESFIIVNRDSESFQRISISQEILSNTPNLVFLVTGKKKKNIVRKIVNKERDVLPLPAQNLINKATGKVIILCDRDAY